MKLSEKDLHDQEKSDTTLFGRFRHNNALDAVLSKLDEMEGE